MRVITGKARGIRLHIPKGDRVRPTTDKVKESLFNIIQYRLEDCVFIDCFAGTGSIGIEALSRGAKEAYFIDNNRDSINLIKKNLQVTKLSDRAFVLQKDIEAGLNTIAKKDITADIIFMDPPYNLKAERISEIISKVNDLNLLSSEGIIIIEHDSGQALDEKIGEFRRYDLRKYGNSTMSYFSKEKVSG